MSTREDREEWRPVVGWAGLYEVSDQGEVRSLPHGGQPGRVLRPSPVGQGYMRVTLSAKPERRPVNIRVHRLVLEAFVGPRPPGLVGCHINGAPADNRLANLRWGSPASNEADKREHGTVAEGRRLPQAKLTDARVREIRARLDQGESQSSLARAYGVDRSLIGQIKRGLWWKHVKEVA